MKKKKGTQLSVDSPNWLLIITVLCFAAFIMGASIILCK